MSIRYLYFWKKQKAHIQYRVSWPDLRAASRLHFSSASEQWVSGSLQLISSQMNTASGFGNHFGPDEGSAHEMDCIP